MRRGFSLVEMMIALALTAVAIAIMSEGVRRAIDFEQRLTNVRQEREVQTATLEAVRARLERLVTAARPATANEETGNEILFAGDAQRLVFVAADPGYPSIAGLYEYRLILSGTSEADDEASPATPLLTVFRRRLTDTATFNTDRGEPAQSWELPLPKALTFRYIAPSGGSSESWTDQANYPALVMLESGNAEFAAMTVSLPQPRPDDEENSE